MFPEVLAWIAVLVVGFTSTGLLIARDWRWGLGLLAAQYVGTAILTGQHWPLGMATAKLVTGWMATAALGMTLTTFRSAPESVEQAWPQGRAFHLFLAGMIVVLAGAATPQIENATGGAGAPVIAGTILLTGIGLLQLGSSSQVSRIVFGLLTVLSGFEVFYAAIEGSILVAGLLAVVTLGIGLVGAYLLNAIVPEDSL